MLLLSSFCSSRIRASILSFSHPCHRQMSSRRDVEEGEREHEEENGWHSRGASERASEQERVQECSIKSSKENNLNQRSETHEDTNLGISTRTNASERLQSRRNHSLHLQLLLHVLKKGVLVSQMPLALIGTSMSPAPPFPPLTSCSLLLLSFAP